MEGSGMLALLIWGFCFILGLGLVLRPGVILRAMVFNPVFLALIMLLVVGAIASMRDVLIQNTLAIAVGVGAAVLGGGFGGVLRRWENGPDV